MNPILTLAIVAALMAFTVLFSRPAGRVLMANEGAPGTFDFRKMVCDLLGLKPDATEAMVNERYDAAMKAEPDDSAEDVKKKMADCSAANETLKTEKEAAEKAKADAEKAVADKTTLAANETSRADAEKKRADDAEAKAKDAQAKLDTATTNFVNERKARATDFVNRAITEGRVTGAEKDALIVNLCNEGSWDKVAGEIAGRAPKLKTTSSVRGVNASPEGQDRQTKVLNAVNEAMESDTNLSYENAFAKVRKEKPELFANMVQPGEKK